MAVINELKSQTTMDKCVSRVMTSDLVRQSLQSSVCWWSWPCRRSRFSSRCSRPPQPWAWRPAEDLMFSLCSCPSTITAQVGGVSGPHVPPQHSRSPHQQWEPSWTAGQFLCRCPGRWPSHRETWPWPQPLGCPGSTSHSGGEAPHDRRKKKRMQQDPVSKQMHINGEFTLSLLWGIIICLVCDGILFNVQISK